MYSDSTHLSQPRAIELDEETGFVWVADRSAGTASGYLSRIRRFDPGSGGDSLRTLALFDSISGPVTSLSMNQFERNDLWFTSAEGDFVGRILDTNMNTYSGSSYSFNRPRSVSYDAKYGIAWIADSSRVVVLDSAGDVQANITGFTFVSQVSSAPGICWIADMGKNQIVRFKRDVNGNRKTTDGMVVDGFQGPVALAADPSDGGVWVADTQAGRVVKLNSDGEIVLTVEGMSLPSVIAINRAYR